MPCYPQTSLHHNSYRDIRTRGLWKEDVLHGEVRHQKYVRNSYLSRTVKNYFCLITLARSDYLFLQLVCNWYFHLLLFLFFFFSFIRQAPPFLINWHSGRVGTALDWEPGDRFQFWPWSPTGFRHVIYLSGPWFLWMHSEGTGLDQSFHKMWYSRESRLGKLCILSSFLSNLPWTWTSITKKLYIWFNQEQTPLIWPENTLTFLSLPSSFPSSFLSFIFFFPFMFHYYYIEPAFYGIYYGKCRTKWTFSIFVFPLYTESRVTQSVTI